MKRHVLAMTLALALGPACAGQKPGIDALFDSMAIEVKPGENRHFIVSDNVDGYLDAVTQSHSQGMGYVSRAGTWLAGYATYVGERANDRGRSREQVLPYGHVVLHAGGASEQMAVLSGRRALAMRVASGAPARLAIQPILPPGVAEQARIASRAADGRAVVVALPAGFVALVSAQDFDLQDELVLRTRRNAGAFTVVAAFADSAPTAEREARALAAGDPIAAERLRLYRVLTRSYLETDDREYNKALNWAKASASMFVVEEFGKGIWAGLPWFRDNWGRDTFIALPGTLLVSGQFADARAVLANFARYQNLDRADKDYGRVPNRVSATDGIIYNTVDGTPWMLREALEYIRYTGDKAFAADMYKLAVAYFDGATANYMDADKLLTHDDADTWMDARIAGDKPWSARGPRAVEIQALWYTALQSGAALAREAGDVRRAAEWSALAVEVRRNFLRLFWDGSTMADRLRKDGSRDVRLRPNQLMLVSIPGDDFVPRDVQAMVTRNAVSGLLYEYGIASLSQDDPWFHPRHENPHYHHKDAAYHNGTVWGWNAGFTVTALNRFGQQDLAWQLTTNLGRQILGLGTLGTMSELLDALPPLRPSGTFAQSWSVAEYARNAYQDYIGFRPDLLEGTLRFEPALPTAWRSAYAVLPFGDGEEVQAEYEGGRWTLKLDGKQARSIEFTLPNPDRSRSRVRFTLAPGVPATLDLRGRPALDGRPLVAEAAQPPHPELGPLRFVAPRAYRAADFPVLRGRDVLQKHIENGGEE